MQPRIEIFVFLSPFAPGFQFLSISLQFMSVFDGSFGERFLSIPGRSLQIFVAFGPHLLKIHDFWFGVLSLSELPVATTGTSGRSCVGAVSGCIHRNFRSSLPELPVGRNFRQGLPELPAGPTGTSGSVWQFQFLTALLVFVSFSSGIASRECPRV